MLWPRQGEGCLVIALGIHVASLPQLYSDEPYIRVYKRPNVARKKGLVAVVTLSIS
jgi:hypothetical protein